MFNLKKRSYYKFGIVAAVLTLGLTQGALADTMKQSFKPTTSDTTLMTPEILQPTDGETIDHGFVNITGVADPRVLVYIKDNTQDKAKLVGTTDASGFFNYGTQVNGSSDTEITYKVYTKNRKGAKSAAVQFTVTVGTQPTYKTFSGSVENCDGDPVDNANVYAYITESDEWWEIDYLADKTESQNGSYSVELPKSDYYLVVARKGSRVDTRSGNTAALTEGKVPFLSLCNE